ncbi:M48 family metalloprotease [Actinomadura macra]|uniref:M48 family metalloprotease n=1 Tax=Actinomadura macra TaxID=46164 RepID=UPI0012FB040D
MARERRQRANFFARWADRRFTLLPIDERPILKEIQQFVEQHAPGVGLRFSFSSSRLCISYSFGRRIAVFLPMTRLWRTDREAARCVLLHELAHTRSGDRFFAQLVPLSSPLTLTRMLLAFYLIIMPGMVLTSTLSPADLVSFQLRGLPMVLLLPIIRTVTTWFLELRADRLALSETNNDAFQRTMVSFWRGGSGSQLRNTVIALRTSSPPLEVRLWFARRTSRRSPGQSWKRIG